MAKDIHVPARIVGGKIPVRASLGQTVIVKEGPDTYTGPVTVTPSESEQTLLTKDKLLTANVVVEPIPSEYIIPTGTEEITVTENGTVTADVTNKASVTVNVDVPIPQPTGAKEILISENGEQTVDVSGFAFARILANVESRPVKPVALPAEYQQVEYIENTGTSYIDTGYELTSDVTEQSVQFFSRPSAASSLFGAERSGAYTGVLWTASGGAISTSLFIGSTKNVISEALQLGIWHTVTIKTTSAASGSFIVDGYERAFSYSGGVLKDYPIWLFNNNNASTAQYAKNRIARFHIIDNGEKVRDLVACYRKTDGVIGMYDIINDVFYTNAGTGVFTKGPDI